MQPPNDSEEIGFQLDREGMWKLIGMSLKAGWDARDRADRSAKCPECKVGLGLPAYEAPPHLQIALTRQVYASVEKEAKRATENALLLDAAGNPLIQA